MLAALLANLQAAAPAPAPAPSVGGHGVIRPRARRRRAWWPDVPVPAEPAASPVPAPAPSVVVAAPAVVFDVAADRADEDELLLLDVL